MTAATDTFGFIFDVLENYAEKNGASSLSPIFKWASNASSAFGSALEKNPVEAGSALIFGLATLVVAGPTIIAGGAIASLAASLEIYSGGLLAGAVAESVSAALIGYVTEQFGESLYKALLNTLDGIVSSLGGTSTSVDASNSSNGDISSNGNSNPNFIIVSPDSIDGYNQLLIDLPTLNQDSDSKAVLAPDNSAIIDPAPAQPVTDSYTGSTITWDGGDGVVHTSTILYQSASGNFVVDPSSGFLAVGSKLVISITPPGATGQELQVLEDQSATAPDGSSINISYDFTNSSGQSVSDSYNSSGIVTTSDQENANGTSQITTYNSDGSSTSTDYSGPNGTGSITDIDQENADGTSQITIPGNSSSGTPTIITYFSGPNGTGSVTKIDQENANGTSQITSYNPDGSSTSTYYSDPDEMGSVTEIDQENSNGSSQITIPGDPNTGTPTITTSYSGPNGTGSITKIDQENTDGTSQITTYGTNGSSTTTTYQGPNGTGLISQADITTPTGTISQNLFTAEYDYSGSGISGYVIYDPYSPGGAVLDETVLYGGDATFYEGRAFQGFDVDPSGNVISWAVGAYLQTGYGYVDLVGNYQGNPGISEYYLDDPDDESYLNTAASGSWTENPASIETSLTVSSAPGQVVQLSDILDNPSLHPQGPVASLLLTGYPYYSMFDLTGTVTVSNVRLSTYSDLILLGGELNTDPITIDPSGTIIGYGTITGDELLNGTIISEGGTLDLEGDISGSGELSLDPGSALLLSGTVADTVNLFFSGTNESLIIGPDADVLANINGFGTGDTIDLAGISATGGTLTSNALTIQEDGGEAITLNVANSAAPQNVYAISDSNGGTDIVLTEPVPVTTAPDSATVIGGLATDIGGLSISIPDGPSVNETITVVLSDSAGILGATQADGSTVTGAGTTILTLSGSLDAINADLSSVTYTGPDTTGTTTNVINVTTSNDQGYGDSQQIDITQDGTLTNNNDGSSQITTYGTDGSSTTTNYKGPDGTGAITEVDISNSTSTVTVRQTTATFSYAGNEIYDYNSGAPVGKISIIVTVDLPAPGQLYGMIDQITLSGAGQQISLATMSLNEGLIGLSNDDQVTNWEIVAHGIYQGGNNIGEVEFVSVNFNYVTYFESVDGISGSDGASNYTNAQEEGNPGIWSLSDIGTSITVSPLPGQIQVLSSILSQENVQAVGSAQNLTIAGSGKVVLRGVTNIPSVILINGGDLVLEEGTLYTDPITIESGGIISGNGIITGEETNNGTITADRSLLDLTGDITGSGLLAIDTGATLFLEGTIAASQFLTFGGSDGVLTIGQNSAILAPIGGFGPGDVIALEGQSTASDVYNPNDDELTLTGSSGTEFTLSLVGTYQPSDFGIINGEISVFFDLNDPAGTPDNQYAFGINSGGTVVGSFTDATGFQQAYIESGNTFTTLADPNTDFSNGGDQAFGINDSGIVVGTFTDSSGAKQSFIEQSGTYVTLSDPLASSTTAEQINNSDTIVGFYLTAGSTIQNGFVESNGSFTTLNDPAGVEGSFLTGINNSGQTVGTYIDASGIDHGFIVSGGSFTTIDDPAADGHGTSAFGINNEGQVVGYYLDSLGVSHGFIDSNGTFTTIDDPNGIGGSGLNNINDDGEIVGYYSLSNGDIAGFTTSVLEVACFASGTRILTPQGEIPVENLGIGYEVITNVGEILPIQWIGHRRFYLFKHPKPEIVQPVLIYAGAIADHVPESDLSVSPDHALFLDGHLVPAKALMNGETIRQLDLDSVTYYHIELPKHAVLMAQGTPVESYLETGNRGAFENGGEPIILHPDFAQSFREVEGCAPFVESGRVVEQIRQRILDRANIQTTHDPSLKIKYREDGSAVIGSGISVPGLLTADPRDRRVLGIKVAAIKVCGGTIALNHSALVEGWHDVEDDGRWTDGNAVIPAELLARARDVSIVIAATLSYPIATQIATQA